MRKVFLSFLCLFSLCLWGQESNVRIGAKAGLSLATFSRGFFYQVEDFAYVPSLYAGATLSVRTDRSLSGKLGLLYSGQGARYKENYTTEYAKDYALGYLSLGYIIHFRLFEHLYLDAGITTDLLVKKDSKVPSPKTFDVAGLVGIEVPLFPSLSLEARAKSGRGGINNYTDYYGGAPFNTELNNLVLQFGAVYYF